MLSVSVSESVVMHVLARRGEELEEMEFLLDPVDRFPLREEWGDSKEPLNLLHAAPQSSVAEQDPAVAAHGVAEAQSSVGAIRPRRCPPASEGSEIKDDPQAPG